MPPTMTGDRRRDGGSSGSGNRGKPPKQVSLTDPQAAWVARKNTDPFFAYDANYLIDNKAGIIVDAEGTRANRIAEIAIAETMIERVKDRFDLRPRRLAGDTVYGAVRLLKWLVDRRSRRMFRSGTSRHAPMAPSAGPTLSSTDCATSTSARMESCCTPPEQSLTAVRFAIVPQSAIAISARSKCSAAPARLCDKFLVIFMRMPAMRPRTGQNRGFRTITPGAQKGRDVFCSHEAHLQARPAATARLERG